MASTIITKNSSTASATPAVGDLQQGELAVNVTDKKVYTKDSSAAIVKLVGSLGNQEASAVAITGGSIAGITDLAVADGGTGSSTAAGARSNLSAAASGANSDITSLSGLTTALSVAQGGTGVTSSTGSGSVVLSNSPTLVTPALGTPSAAVLTNATGLPLSTGISGLGTGVATFLGTPSSANLLAAVTDETGTGALVFANSPTLVTPALGTPASATLTNATGLPIGTGVSGLGTGVATALAVNVGSAGAPVVNGGVLGTPSSGTLTNATGLPISTGVSGLGTGVATALAVNVGSAGAPVVNGGALGTPSSGTVTNLTGTASININGTVGATTPTTGSFTTLAASGAVTLSGGTANGVTYLNGSKVLTSNSALTFDGTTLTNNNSGQGFLQTTTSASTYASFKGNTGGTTIWTGIGTDTGISWLGSVSNHDVVFRQNNSEQMRLTSTGLGIGTSSPSAKLHVSGQSRVADSSNAANYILIGSGANAPRGGNSVMAQTGSMVMGTEAASNLIFITNAAEAARLDSAGNLGLGVTPSAWGGGFIGFQIKNSMSLWAGTGSAAYYSNNVYYDGTSRKYVSSATAAEYEQGGGIHSWKIAPSGTAGNAISFTQAMTLDASGNLGVGTTSPAAKLDVRLAASNGGDVINIGNINGSVYGGLGIVAASPYSVELFGTVLTFRTGGNTTGSSTERARIDSSGNLLVGTTSTAINDLGFRVYGQYGLITCTTNTADYSIFNKTTTTTGKQIEFRSANSSVGDITSSSTATSYNTSSDYRLKNTIAPMTGALAKVALLKPCTYKWNADGSDGEGFIAHELAEVVPQCVTGEKDAVDEDGNPKYQGIDTSFLVATVVAALQELKASMDAVKAEFDAYKASHP